MVLLCLAIVTIWPFAQTVAAQSQTLDLLATPPGFKRVPAAVSSFAASLQKIEIVRDTVITSGDGKRLLCRDEKVASTRILPFDNKRDTGVDGIVRLWGEFAWKRGSTDKISFPLDNGQVAKWSEWKDGLRPRESGGRFVFTQVTTPDGGYGNYMRYLSFVAEEMGALALKRESSIITDDSLAVGDIAVAVTNSNESRVALILDVCKGPRGEKLFLVGTSGTPSAIFYIPRPYSPVQGFDEWFTLDGLKWMVGEGARVDMRRVSLK